MFSYKKEYYKNIVISKQYVPILILYLFIFDLFIIIVKFLKS